MKKTTWMIFLITIFVETTAFARPKLDFSFGIFALEASTSSSTGSASGPGIYQVGLRYPFLPRLEFVFGYSLLIAKTISGDKSFGPDIGINYYPFSEAEALIESRDGIKLTQQEQWRPFVGGLFHQRQYQSTQASYGGFGFAFGTEYEFDPRFTLKGEFRAIQMLGPDNGNATENAMSFGVTFPF